MILLLTQLRIAAFENETMKPSSRLCLSFGESFGACVCAFSAEEETAAHQKEVAGISNNRGWAFE